MASVFSHKPSPVLLPLRSIVKLMHMNQLFFNNTIYELDPQLVYQYGTVFPVFPLKAQMIAFVLRLPRILQPSLSTLYCTRNVGIQTGIKQIRYRLPPYMIEYEGKMQTDN